MTNQIPNDRGENQFAVDLRSEHSAIDLYNQAFQISNTSLPEEMAGNLMIRSFLQLAGQVPGIGAVASITDLNISLAAEKIKESRYQKFLQMMTEKVDHNAKSETLLANIKKNPEAALDLYMFAQEESLRAQSETKRQRLVNIIRRAAWDDIIWEEAKEHARIVATLEDHDVAVLAFADSVPTCDDGLFNELSMVTLSDKPQNAEKGPKFLQDQFTTLPTYVLRRICSRLVSEGLLHDEGIGRYDTKAMEYFYVTMAGKRFLSWISNTN